MAFLTQLLFHPFTWYHAHQLLAGQIGVDGLLALSIWLTLYSGQLTLANAGFMAIGAYSSVILTGGTTSTGPAAAGVHLPLAVAMLVGIALAALVAFVIGLPVLRLKGVFLAIATLGFGEALRYGLILNLGITGKGQGLNNPHATLTSGITPIWLALVVLAFLAWRLTGTKTGHAWAAIREDQLAAAAQGIDVARYKMVAFVLGAMVAALAGGLGAHLSFLIDSNDYTFTQAIDMLIWAVVGGIAFVIGPIVGAVLLTILPEVLRFTQDYRQVINGIILIAIVLFRPDGLFTRRKGTGNPSRLLRGWAFIRRSWASRRPQPAPP
ncbi:MAG: branched-chain amino acid transport system permease protein [Acidimicrobiaceae bacterium]|jgi:branched-chain amino acid transport system permease protein|nr:branched-chain amino acid transport system permease protein [Acidimicrobiaceae bacterium]